MAAFDVKKYGAKGDGRTNDTAAFNRAVQACSNGGEVCVPKGRYMIDAETSVQLKSDMTFKMYSGAELHVIPNSEKSYKLIRVHGCKNIKILGGKLVGDRKKHKGKGGDWGIGIDIRGSENVHVQDVESREMWGDGFYIADLKGKAKAKNIVLKNVVGDYNRRQGLSVISVHGLQVLDSVFSNTRGTRPENGIDFEPNKPDQHCRDVIEDVLVKGCKFLNNNNSGVEFAVKKGTARRCRVVSCQFEDNKKAIKSDTYSRWQNLIYTMFGYPTSIRT